MIINTNPEFGIELCCVIPYANWLQKQGKLEKVVTSKGMKPFYFFCDNVDELHTYRTVDNKQAGMDSLPNNWIYGFKDNAKLYKEEWKDWKIFADVERGCGILDYREWSLPDYTAKFGGDEKFKFEKPHIVISNRYNWEHGVKPQGYFTIQCLYEMFNYLTESGYKVIYKRPKNTEFPLDQNEVNTLRHQETLTANVKGVGVIDDFQLTSYYDDVILIDDLVSSNPDLSYNEIQLKLYSNADGFISMGGGTTLLTSVFNKPIISYMGGTHSELSRENFFEDSNGVKNIYNFYYRMNQNLEIFIDKECTDMQKNESKKFLEKIKTIF